MKEELKFGDLRKDLERNKAIATKHLEEGVTYDQIYDSTLHNIGSSFSKVLPENYIAHVNNNNNGAKIEDFGEAFKKYIEDTLSKKESGNRTAIEFGGPGSKLFSGFSNGFFSKTVGVCLEDLRPVYKKMSDSERGHSVVVADILETNDKEKFTEIENSLGNRKVDLIVSRLMGPLNSEKKIQGAIILKRNPAVLDRVIRKWYSMLNDGGLLFAQFEYFDEHDPYIEKKRESELNQPPIMEIEENVKNWINEINKRFSDKIEIQLGRGIIRLHKKPGAPEELPRKGELFGNK